MSFCSPVREKVYEKDRTCFNKKALGRLVTAWNASHPDARIQGASSKSKGELWSALDERMQSICKGSGREWCWVDKIQDAKKSPEVVKSLRPAKPKEWYKRPFAWLSNFDIEAVMRQYQDDASYKYKFLGVYPIDFAGKTMFGACLFQEMCALDITKFIKRGYKYVGMITNLDRHDQDGSHWTSLFVCMDPSLPCYGAYYYDSVAHEPPKEMREFMKNVKQQCEAYHKGVGNFNIAHNTSRHQFGNTECGVFSMAYQIRWITKLREKPATVFEDVVHIRLRDKDVHKLRNILFRPNTKAHVGGGQNKK
jgi:hypothetical protein